MTSAGANVAGHGGGADGRRATRIASVSDGRLTREEEEEEDGDDCDEEDEDGVEENDDVGGGIGGRGSGAVRSVGSWSLDSTKRERRSESSSSRVRSSKATTRNSAPGISRERWSIVSTRYGWGDSSIRNTRR